MPIPSVTFRSELDPVVRKELDQFDAEVTEYLLQEHDDDGKHTNITAKSLTVSGPITANGAVVTNGPVTTKGPSVTIAGSPLEIANPAYALLNLRDTGAAVDNRLGQLFHDNGTIYLRTVNDAITAAYTTLALQHDGQSVFSGPVRERSRATPIGEWTPYTVTWRGSGSNPTVGDGFVVGYYMLIGKTCFFQIRTFSGTTGTAGSGYWSWSVPLPMGGYLPYGNVRGWAYYGMTDHYYQFFGLNSAFFGGPAQTVGMFSGSPGAQMGATLPEAYGNYVQIFIEGYYSID